MLPDKKNSPPLPPSVGDLHRPWETPSSGESLDPPTASNVPMNGEEMPLVKPPGFSRASGPNFRSPDPTNILAATNTPLEHAYQETPWPLGPAHQDTIQSRQSHYFPGATAGSSMTRCPTSSSAWMEETLRNTSLLPVHQALVPLGSALQASTPSLQPHYFPRTTAGSNMTTYQASSSARVEESLSTATPLLQVNQTPMPLGLAHQDPTPSLYSHYFPRTTTGSGMATYPASSSAWMKDSLRKTLATSTTTPMHVDQTPMPLGPAHQVCMEELLRNSTVGAVHSRFATRFAEETRPAIHGQLAPDLEGCVAGALASSTTTPIGSKHNMIATRDTEVKNAASLQQEKNVRSDPLAQSSGGSQGAPPLARRPTAAQAGSSAKKASSDPKGKRVPRWLVKKVPCNLCDKKFESQHKLSIHMLKHTGERPYVCHLCGLTFDRTFCLKRHQKTHTSLRPYSCWRCGRPFRERYDCETHMATGVCLRNLTLKNVPCDTCGDIFRTELALKMHVEKIHTGEVLIHCEFCRAPFSRDSFLRSHMEARHGV